MTPVIGINNEAYNYDTDEYDGIESYTFISEEIISKGLLNGAYKTVQEVADVLACNVEVPELNNDGCVEIKRANFNDSYGDMMADLRGEPDDYDSREHDEDED